jgi:hypothetical protein
LRDAGGKAAVPPTVALRLSLFANRFILESFSDFGAVKISVFLFRFPNV